MQRALGEHDPCVEVLPEDIAPPPYHRAALAASELLCVGAADPYGAAGAQLAGATRQPEGDLAWLTRPTGSPCPSGCTTSC